VAHAPKRKIKNISSIKSLMTSLILQEIYTISLWVKECLNMMPSILLDNKHEGLTCCSKLLDLNFRLHTHTHTHTNTIWMWELVISNVFSVFLWMFTFQWGTSLWRSMAAISNIIGRCLCQDSWLVILSSFDAREHADGLYLVLLYLDLMILIKLCKQLHHWYVLFALHFLTSWSASGLCVWAWEEDSLPRVITLVVFF
jgi:hypothetical protein